MFTMTVNREKAICGFNHQPSETLGVFPEERIINQNTKFATPRWHSRSDSSYGEIRVLALWFNLANHFCSKIKQSLHQSGTKFPTS